MKRQLMAEEWDKFARTVVNPNAHPTQKQEMRRAFYAGAQSFLFRVMFAPESESTDADVQIMEDLYHELQDFAKLVQSGRA